ncbi:hypothetical protein Tco_0819144 [Tanacetum coccineum]|uniref:Uncharacterized protein n=1 Tax=Tanacetum coccineum TaxID=301880 RepID=A0ABQ5A5Q3_9ASTR
MPTEMELTLEQTQQGVSYEVSVFTMKMEILLEPTSNKLMVEHAEYDESNTYVLERFNTTAGNPVKKILLKLNLSDHRLFKDGGGDDVPFHKRRHESSESLVTESDETFCILAKIRVHEANMGTINPSEGLHYRHYYDFDEVAYTFQVEHVQVQTKVEVQIALIKSQQEEVDRVIIFCASKTLLISVRKKDKAQAEKTQTQAVMCLARLATTFASITAVESKHLDELAESGADHDIVVFVVQ